VSQIQHSGCASLKWDVQISGHEKKSPSSAQPEGHQVLVWSGSTPPHPRGGTLPASRQQQEISPAGGSAEAGGGREHGYGYRSACPLSARSRACRRTPREVRPPLHVGPLALRRTRSPRRPSRLPHNQGNLSLTLEASLIWLGVWVAGLSAGTSANDGTLQW
jgi:hypothetical protein